MATINLCHIPSFNQDYRNVLRFNTLNEQLTFMNSKIILSFNVNVKLDNLMTTIDIPTSYNQYQVKSCDYLFTKTEGNRYLFFFITSIEALSPSTCRLHIDLDVWQTYHLSLNLYTSYVERCHVPRWNNSMPIPSLESEPFSDYEKVVYKSVTAPYVSDDSSMGVYVYATVDPIGKMDSRPSVGGGGGSDIPIGGECGNPSEGIPTPNGFLFIKGYEGLAQYAHNIGDGVMTIGYGCTDAYDGDNYVLLKANEPVSDELASTIMAQSLITNYGLPLKNSLASDGITVNSHEFDAILSFVYNAGLGSWNNSPMRTALINGDKDAVYYSWLTTNILQGSQFEAGLRARRQAEANIFKSGEYELRTIVIYGQGGTVTGSLNASDSHVPAIITDECQQSGTISSYDCIDGDGHKWLFPVGGRISSVYPNYPDGSYHGAIDIAGNKLQPIYPPENNMTVYRSGWNTGGYGNLCILYHAPTDTYHYFAHQNELPLVSEGQTLSIHDCIGYVGTTGNSTGYHLHWEIRRGDLSTKINPCESPSLSVGMTITRGQGGY